MGKVHYSILDDMEKYRKKHNIKFNRECYENLEEDVVRKEFKEWYAGRLPIDLLTWCRVNAPGDNMIYKESYWTQIMLIRDRINSLFYDDVQEYNENPVMVINTHMSKSITLPIYLIDLKKHGVQIILRDNIYDWLITVISDREITVDFNGLFREDLKIQKTNSYTYSEFTDDQIKDCFKDNKKQFTLEIQDDYNLYVFMYLLENFLRRGNE